jgi:hypothetical protein
MAYVDSLTLSLNIIAASNTAGVGYVCLPTGITGEYQLVSVDRVSNLAITASDTDYRTFTVYGADKTTAQASRVTTVAGGATVAGTPESLAVTGGANAMFSAGEAIHIAAAEAGTGPACNEGFTCHLVKVR